MKIHKKKPPAVAAAVAPRKRREAGQGASAEKKKKAEKQPTRTRAEGGRKRRRKKKFSDPLENVVGLGAKKFQTLIRHFGGRKEILHASEKDIKTVPGIGPALAKRIFDAINN